MTDVQASCSVGCWGVCVMTGHSYGHVFWGARWNIPAEDKV